MDADEWIQAIGVLGALVSVGVALTQYGKAQAESRKAQIWKRAEYVAGAVKEFEARPAVRRVQRMLDYNGSQVELPPGKMTSFSDESLTRALAQEGEFTEEEAAIRDAFSEYLDGLERFETFVEAGLVSAAEFRPYLGYWLDIIGDPANDRKPADFRQALWLFIEVFKFQGVQTFLLRFGRNIRVGGPAAPGG